MYLLCGYAVMYDGELFLKGIALDGADSAEHLTVAVIAESVTTGFGGQLVGAAIIFAWVFGVSLAVWFTIKALMGIRVSEEDEYNGVDVSECGMDAYPEFTLK